MNIITVTLVIVAIILSYYFIKVVEGMSNNKLRIEHIIIMCLCVFAIIQAIAYDNDKTDALKEARSTSYEIGYEDAINDAYLLEVNEETYTIIFNGEIHIYDR